jgi:hypothetical protein
VAIVTSTEYARSTPCNVLLEVYGDRYTGELRILVYMHVRPYCLQQNILRDAELSGLSMGTQCTLDTCIQRTSRLEGAGDAIYRAAFVCPRVVVADHGKLSVTDVGPCCRQMDYCFFFCHLLSAMKLSRATSLRSFAVAVDSSSLRDTRRKAVSSNRKRSDAIMVLGSTRATIRSVHLETA